MSAVVHIAGHAVNFAGHLRQLCAWCGEKLIDVDLSLVAVMPEPDGSVKPYATWETNALVAIEAGAGQVASYLVPHDGVLPPNSCARKVKLRLVGSDEAPP